MDRAIFAGLAVDVFTYRPNGQSADGRSIGASLS
jgi:hypothetical protein